MKRYLIIILLATALVNNSSAQTSKDICSSKTLSWSSKPASYTTVTEAKNMITDIISVIGLKPNFEVMASDVDNAAAVIYESKRYILYNPDFINRLNTAAGNNWASISILAHEIGHHLDGHTLDNVGSQPDKELEADEFSGFVLRRMGATLAKAQAAMKIAADYKRSLTHPGQAERLTAIANGWNTANQQQGGKDLAKVTPPKNTKQPEIYTTTNNDQAEQKNHQQTTMQTRQRNTRTQQNDDGVSRYPVIRTSNQDQTTAANSYILADLNFTADESSTYYLTNKYNVVKVSGNQQYVIGRMTKTDSKEYPYLISDDAGTKLWVEESGYIINGNYKRVGYLKVRSTN